jgi:hypothetical protein
VITSGSGPPRWPVEGVDGRELFGGEVEVEYVDVFGDPLRFGRLGDHRAALLQVPAQHHLGRGFAVGLGDAADHWVLQGAGVLPVAVEGNAADRGPGLGEDVVLGVEGLYVALSEVGVDLDLVDCRHYGGFVKQCGEVVNHEVADSDGADLPVAEQGFQRPVRL